MARLYARQYILQNTAAGPREFFPGDVIPEPEKNPEAEAWAESGAAYWVEKDPPASARAVMMTAEPGVPGLATGGEGAPDNLVGKVPKTPQRRRGRRK
jgi:hypothetical protein